MVRSTQSMAPVLVALVGLTGCASSAGGGDQLENTVYATHRLVQNLDRNLSASVTRLNETTAELVTRVESADRETRQLLSVVEENQRKLDMLTRKLDDLTATLYRHLNLSPPSPTTFSPPPSTTPPQGVESGEVILQPPASSPSTFNEPGFNEPRAEIEQLPPAESIALASGDADTFYAQAQDLYNAERYDAALEQFDAYLRQYPNTANASNAQYWKAHSYFKLERYDRAVDEFAVLINNYPSSGKVPIALHNQAVAYSRLNQINEAIATFERLIRDYPNDVVADMGREKLRQLQEIQ